MAKRTARWRLQGPPEGPDEGIHVVVVCSRCRNAFGEYRVVPNLAMLLPVGHERNEPPSEPGWGAVTPRVGGRGRLTGARAYTVEEIAGRPHLVWRCRGRYDTRCRNEPKIERSTFIKEVRALAAGTSERPIEIRL
ncbi:MAG: hypothetical protein E6G58_01155 [Actinobacteria bacterium]|nr:MAG: hypothetical protein E6G58_01155 [Actinomycetota bacterium]